MSDRSPGATGAGADTDREPGEVHPPRAPLAIVIETAREARVAEGRRLAAAMDVPILGSRALTRGEATADLLLAVTREDLQIALPARGRARPGRGERAYREKGVRVDLGGLDPRTGAGGLSRKQPIARAVGRTSELVLDGTAGLGQDARLLAAMGYRVIAVERSPVLHALLEDGLRRAAADPVVAGMLGDRLKQWPEPKDVCEVLAGMAAAGDVPPDVVYLDPMFPPRRKETALARKSVRMIREVVGADEDAAAVLAEVRQRVRRVVVKRPPDARPLTDDATNTIETKLARYDVYVDGTRPGGPASRAGSEDDGGDGDDGDEGGGRDEGGGFDDGGGRDDGGDDRGRNGGAEDV